LPRFKDSARRARHSRAVAAHTTTLDVRQLPLWRRLPAILAAFDGLAPGEAIELLVDLDPWPLRGYLDATREGACEWLALENGPDVWRVRLSRSA
jgi:uncharacterized protein (DUF2249 family)